MNWVPVAEFAYPWSIWLCQCYYKGVGIPRQSILNGEVVDDIPEAPSKYYAVLIVINPETGKWVRSKTKHGDLSTMTDAEAADNLDFLTNSAFRPLDFSDNLGHDDSGRMMFYTKRVLSPANEGKETND